MDTPNIEQSISELTFYLYQRSLHPELFNIYSSRQFFQGDYEVLIWIIGCSHVVSVFNNNDCMTELICPPDQMLPKRCLVDRIVCRGEKSRRCVWAKNFSYMMNFQVETMSANLFRQSHIELTNAGKKRGMLVPFPQWSKGELVPFSYLDYEARQDELQLHAFHVFPEQQTILKSQSLYTMRNKRK